jgi:glycosyltransferase involved in cell wall biosynthesis
MHVAINGWFWKMSHTGSGQYVRQLVAYLRKVEPTLEITLVVPDIALEDADIVPGVNYIQTNTNAKSRLGKVWFEQSVFPKYAKLCNADLAHVPYWGSPLSCGIPVVVSVLDVIPLIYPVYARGLANRLYTSLVSTSARAATHVITISQTSKLDIEERLNIPKERISVTYLAPDERFHPRMGAERDAQIREKYKLPQDFILYLGGFDRRKQVDQLLLAYTFVQMAEGVSHPLVIAGAEPAYDNLLFPDVRTYAQNLGVADNVHWIGYVDEADKPALYRLADVFVYPSAYEGFGLPPLEAMASGTPTIAFDTVIADEIYEDAAYLVEDARRMGGAMIALLIQESFREAMINQGLALVTKYNWRKTAKQTLDVYRRVLAQA